MKFTEIDSNMQYEVQRFHKRVPDRMLSMLARIAEADSRGDDALDVTLIVGGSTFTGRIASERTWAEAIADMPGGGGAPVSKLLIEVIDSRDPEPELSDERADEMSDKELTEHFAEWASPFIHLVDAHQFVFGGTVPSHPTPMRFRLDEVQGWYLGKLERGEG